MSVITIVGAGVMGSAMSWPAGDNGHEIRLVGTHLDADLIQHAMDTGQHKRLGLPLLPGVKLYQLERVEEALIGANLLVCGVSSFGVRWFADRILPLVPSELPILSITKGLLSCEEAALISFPEYYQQRFPNKSLTVAAVGGPCNARELALRHHTEICFCSKDAELLSWLKKTFETPYYHIHPTTDVSGLECAVAMKNAYALGVSLCTGLTERDFGPGVDHLHANPRAALFGQSLREMVQLMKLLGGELDSLYYGAGDLYGAIGAGRSGKVGVLIGKGLATEEAQAALGGETLESIVIVQSAAAGVRKLIEQGRIAAGDFPLLLHLDDVLHGRAAADIPWEKF